MPEFVIRRVGGDGGGEYPRAFDPDWRPAEATRRALGAPDHQTGLAEWTSDPAEAMRFPDGGAAFAFWSTPSTVVPLRPDGKPNRPLTAYTVEVVNVALAEAGR